VAVLQEFGKSWLANLTKWKLLLPTGACKLWVDLSIKSVT